jgi:hypothetical protein
MTVISCADPVLVRRAAERLYRFDLATAAVRVKFDPSSDECRHHDLAVAISRARLLQDLNVARGIGTA